MLAENRLLVVPVLSDAAEGVGHNDRFILE